MHKYLTVYTLVFISVIIMGCASVPISERSYQEVVQLEGLKKENIYNKSLQWTALNFKSSKAVIQYQDMEEGTIIGKFSTDTYRSPNCITECTMKIEIKEGKARLSMTADNLICGSSIWEVNSSLVDHEIEIFKTMASNYKLFILNKSKQKSDEW